MRKTAALLLVLVVGRAASAVAGVELNADELLRAATPGGVALVDNDVDGAATLRAWLSPTHPDRPVGALRGVCVPDRRLLAQWQQQHAQHPGRPVWDAVLRDGKTTQIVFLAERGGVLVPVCEGEVLRGQGFAQSPQRAAWQRELVDKLSAPSSAPAAPVPAPAPLPSSGCW